MKNIITKLEKINLIHLVKIPKDNLENDEEVYFHTSKVKENMLNDLLRFEKKFGWDFKEVEENSKDKTEYY